MGRWTGSARQAENTEKIIFSGYTAFPWEVEATAFECNKYCRANNGKLRFIRGFGTIFKPERRV